jgi:hypothetical protein
LAIAKWADEHAPQHYHSWKPFNHPQLGAIEIGGPDDFNLITNPPEHLLKVEVAKHAEFALYQAMLSPKLEVLLCTAEKVAPYMPAQGGAEGTFIWRIKVGVANTGFFPTNVTAMALKINAALPVSVELQSVASAATESCDSGSSTIKPSIVMADGCAPAKVTCGQLQGRMATRVNWRGCDGTPERALGQWLVLAKEGEAIRAVAEHCRAGRAEGVVVLK